MIWSDVTFFERGPSLFSPYEPKQLRTWNGKKVKSFGQSTAGYDIRSSSSWRIVRPDLSPFHVVDLQDPQSVEAAFIAVDAEYIDIAPHSIVYAQSLEYITMPRDASGLAIGKSTDARSGGNVYITLLEPGWEGYLVIEIVNNLPCYRRFYAGEGIAQIQMQYLDNAPAVAYSDRPSAYQGQRDVMLGRL
jgi:dCTP deaminase